MPQSRKRKGLWSRFDAIAAKCILSGDLPVYIAISKATATVIGLHALNKALPCNYYVIQ